MVEKDVIAGIETFCKKIDSSPRKGCYSSRGRSALAEIFAGKQQTKANRVWLQSEYIVATLDDAGKQKPIANYVGGFKKINGPSFLILQETKTKWGLYDDRGIKIGDTAYLENMFKEKKRIHELVAKGFPWQKIYFGAPGCGKSHHIEDYFIKNGVPEDRIFRVTFHPDTDYSSFVGSFKPKMDNRDIIYQFVPQAFTKAYLCAYKHPQEKVFLVIEEINRGDCAQIFGDIFQLLDREDGISKYAISVDSDLLDYIKSELTSPDEAEGWKGDKLRLPANLSIVATMNTSDQSLYAMDSAFKRRWEWCYKPITKGEIEYKININGAKYDWWAFVKGINNSIKGVTLSADKQIGYWFIKLRKGNKDIDAHTFASKVLFYLWNDVFKEFVGADNPFVIDGEVRHFVDFYKDENLDIELIKKFIEKFTPVEV